MKKSRDEEVGHCSISKGSSLSNLAGVQMMGQSLVRADGELTR
jgi:hypothetical protein